jgi:ribonuclease kappa
MNSLIISVFAVVILSVLGALFKANHHSMMDGKEDPEDGAAVAATAFGAVGVYGVCAYSFSLSQRGSRSVCLLRCLRTVC